MGIKDLRTPVTTKPKNQTAGRRVVVYMDAKGKTYDAIVLGAGTSSGLKLKLAHPHATILDNVAKATNEGSVSCYRAR